jgi:hypothetical protein
MRTRLLIAAGVILVLALAAVGVAFGTGRRLRAAMG